MSSESLINRYRPISFKEVIGQPDVVRSFRKTLDDRTSHSFLFIGPAGCGKTTLSRIGAHYVGSTRSDLIEVDAASHSGVDDMQSLTEALNYRPLGKVKSLIVDEAHSLSPNAWRSLLKNVEEPPEWVYWFFCTTDPSKVPDTIKTRCSIYSLKPVPRSELVEYLTGIVEAEGFKTNNQIVELCARMSEGSQRRALSCLSVCYDVADRAEAARLISDLDAEEGGSGFELARALANGWTWSKIQRLLEKMSKADEGAEGIRHVVRSYFTKVIVDLKEEKAVCQALRVLDNFSVPFNTSDGSTPVIIATGRCLF